MRLNVGVNAPGDSPRRLNKVAAITVVVFAISLIAFTGCFGGSDDSSSDVTIKRSSRVRATSPARTTSSSRETTSDAGHETVSEAGQETTSDAGHETVSDASQETTSDAGHETVSDASHDSGQAIAVSNTTVSSDVSHGDAVSSPDAEVDHGTSDEAGEEADHGPTHWEYTGGVGQNYWGLLEESFNACVDGSAQSPIDVRDTLVADLEDISFHYNPAMLVVSNNGHTIQASYGMTDQGDGGFMIVDGQEFQLLQFHFHRPSEHTVNGHQAAMEMHLVHVAADGTLAVVGVLIEAGTFNSQLEPVWAVMPHAAGDEVTMETLVDVDRLLPQDRRTYRYPGSLTTPPCSEGVKWNLMVSPISVSSGQVDTFKELYFFNARYTQPLNGRVILEDVSVGQ